MEKQRYTTPQNAALITAQSLKRCIQILLEAGADGKLTSFSSTPYSNAAEYKKIAKQILKFETKTQYENFAKDDIAAFAKQVDAYRLQLWIEKDLGFAKELIFAGAGKDMIKGFSPMFTALELDDIELLKFAYQRGVFTGRFESP